MVEIVAEVGVNAEGSLECSKKLAHAAMLAGADAVKFQRFTTATHPELERYILTNFGWESLFIYCREIGIEPFASPFSPADVAFLERIGVKRYKIAKGMRYDVPLLDAIIKTGKPVIRSADAEIGTKFSVGRTLHCVGKYPTHIRQTLLGRVPVFDGYSSHTGRVEDCVAAAALGATIIEAHIMFHTCKSADRESSLCIKKFTEMVRLVRAITGEKDG